MYWFYTIGLVKIRYMMKLMKNLFKILLFLLFSFSFGENLKNLVIEKIVGSYYNYFDSIQIEIKRGKPSNSWRSTNILVIGDDGYEKFVKDYHFPENMFYFKIIYSDTLNNIKWGEVVYNFDLKEKSFQYISHYLPLDNSGHMDNLGGNKWYDFDCDNYDNFQGGFFKKKEHKDFLCDLFLEIPDSLKQSIPVE